MELELLLRILTVSTVFFPSLDKQYIQFKQTNLVLFWKAGNHLLVERALISELAKWVQVLVLSLSGCAVLDKSLYYSEPQPFLFFVSIIILHYLPVKVRGNVKLGECSWKHFGNYKVLLYKWETWLVFLFLFFYRAGAKLFSSFNTVNSFLNFRFLLFCFRQ